MELSEVNCPGLSPEQIEGLKVGGITTNTNFLLNSQEKVMSCGMLSNMQYEVLKQSFLDLLRPVAVSAKNLAMNEDLPMSTGIQGLDGVLGGGMMGGEVLEIYGRPGTCKTQMCMKIAAEFCHFRSQPLSVVYFDLKNDFRATRFRSMCGDNQEALKNIVVVRSSTFGELLEDIRTVRIETSVKKSFYSNLKLVVLDSLPMVVYPAVDEDPSKWRFQLESLFREILCLKNMNDGIAVICVNHAVKVHSKSAWNRGQSAYRSAMGKFWNHKPDFRLYLTEERRSACGRYICASLEKSTRTQSQTKFECVLNTDGTISMSPNV